jgi:hypothetical protein
MEQNEKALFRLLVERTRVLAVVCDNAAEVLSEDFKGMVLGPLADVQAILVDCPVYDTWNGTFSENDIIIEEYRHESQPNGPPRGVKIRHLPTDLSVESYTKQTPMENEMVARRALADIVQRRWEREQTAQRRRAAAE